MLDMIQDISIPSIYTEIDKERAGVPNLTYKYNLMFFHISFISLISSFIFWNIIFKIFTSPKNFINTFDYYNFFFSYVLLLLFLLYLIFQHVFLSER